MGIKIRIRAIRHARLVCSLVCVFVMGMSNTWTGAEPAWIARGAQGMVAADSEYASQAGLEILMAGGNAVDAAVATSFALAVTRPYSTGLGGGGFMVARFADGRVVVQDFRETAPEKAHTELFLRARERNPSGPSPSEFGHLAVGVPGLVAGRCQALAQFGTLPLPRVLAPAVRLARDGFAVDEDYVARCTGILKTYEKYPALKKSCGYVYKTFLREGNLFASGETLKQPALANLIEAIGRDGPDFFYQGPAAAAIAAEISKGGGILTAKDLANYKPKMRDPLVFDYRGFRVITMPSPSSGGVALAESLNILDSFDLAGLGKKDAGAALHIQVEAMKHAFADRARWMGDQDFVKVPVEQLMSQPYADSLAKRIAKHGIGKLADYGSAVLPDDAGTSHFCVADRLGNVVSSTETINTEFGSLAAVEEWGLVLNNEMDDFTAEPGKANAFGLVQSSANAVAPGKRPLSSMSPTIVLKNGEPYLLVGASGGPRIISGVLHVMLGVMDQELSLEEAIERPRPHHQWQPDKVFFDRAPGDEAVSGLKSRGHNVADERRGAVVQAIMKTKDGFVGASDPRKGGIPKGY